MARKPKVQVLDLLKKIVIGVAFSDLHTHNWKNFSINNSRLNNHLRVLEEISKACIKHKCPAFFTGDMFDNPKQLPNVVMGMFFKAYQDFFETPGIKMYAISGNHDQSESNTYTHKSPTYLTSLGTTFKTFHLLDGVSIKLRGDTYLCGIPYLKHNDGIEKYIKQFKKEVPKDALKILFVHTEYPGATNGFGYSFEDVPGIPSKKVFKDFDLVLSGHIHKPQKLADNVVMLGAPLHQSSEDEGCDMGYWLIYGDLSYRFVPLRMFPQFITLKPGEEAPDDKHFYLQSPVTPPSLSVDPQNKEFMSIRAKDLSKAYCRHIQEENPTRIKLLTELLSKAQNNG